MKCDKDRLCDGLISTMYYAKLFNDVVLNFLQDPEKAKHVNVVEVLRIIDKYLSQYDLEALCSQ